MTHFKTLTFLGILFIGGSLLTPLNAQAQSGSSESFEQYIKEKIVRKSYDKTYKRASRFLEKDLRKMRKSGQIQKEITPMEWWNQEYLMTMDPQKGRPTPEVLLPVLRSLNSKQVNFRASPGTDLYPWVSRGPNDIAGRTRALCWDQADSKQLRVWAGGVTGGLWVNNDISNANSEWKLVSGLWDNLNVTCIAQDPNNSDILYVGTGEGFGTTASSSRGLGIFKSTDAGKTWSQLSNTEEFYYINDIAVRSESGVSVLYVAVDILFYQGQWHGNSTNIGLLRSTDGGSNFSNVSPFITSQSQRYVVSDIEIGADNRLWVGTRKNNYSTNNDQGGGRILYSDNGTTFTESYKNNGALKGRVELACAPSSKDTLYAVLESGGVAHAVVRSFNGGSNWSTFAEPADADNGIPSTDFTRNQAWYDLIIAVNPIDASELVIGGIDFFMSKKAGDNWVQISKWSNNPGLDQLSCSYVHADMHAAMYSQDGKRLVVGTDGGVFYADDIRNNPWNSSTAFVERNNRYVITQYYSGSISQKNENFILGGAQDNGTSYTQDTGFNPKNILFGGDGGYCFIHPNSDDALVFSYVKNNFYSYVDFQLYYLAQDNNTGSFINPAGLDFVNDNLLTQKGKGTLYRNSITGNTNSLETITFATSVNDLASAFHVIKRKSNGKARLFIGSTLGNIWYSDNPEAATPTFTALGSVNAGNINAIESLAGSEDTLALTITNYGVNNVYITKDGGSNWIAIDGNLPNMPVWDIVLNPFTRKEAIIATELGMYQCLDIYASSPIWTPIHKGMGAVKTMMLDYNSAKGTIMAATHGRGFFTSDAWVRTEPVAYFSLKDTVICQGTEITLIDSSINKSDTRNWNITPSGFSYVKSSNKNDKIAYVQFNDAGTYTIKLEIDDKGIKTSKTLQLTVLNTLSSSINLKPSTEAYCEGDDIMLNATLSDEALKSLKDASISWFRNGTELPSNKGNYSLNLLAPLVNNEKYEVHFTADYACLSPKTAISNEYIVGSAQNTALVITRVWDTLFSNYVGSGTVEWYRNNIKIGTGLRYNLIDNGTFHARMINKNCIGPNSNSIVYSSLGIDELKTYLQIGPNPSKGALTIVSNHHSDLQAILINSIGAIIKDGFTIPANGQYHLDMEVANGMYYVIISDATGTQTSYKWLVEN